MVVELVLVVVMTACVGKSCFFFFFRCCVLVADRGCACAVLCVCACACVRACVLCVCVPLSSESGADVLLVMVKPTYEAVFSPLTTIRSRYDPNFASFYLFIRTN